jgi:hypothetical protein
LIACAIAFFIFEICSSVVITPLSSVHLLNGCNRLEHPAPASRYHVDHQQYHSARKQSPGTLSRDRGYSSPMQPSGNQSEAYEYRGITHHLGLLSSVPALWGTFSAHPWSDPHFRQRHHVPLAGGAKNQKR